MSSRGGTAEESWAGNVVGAQALVDVDENTSVRLLVKSLAEGTSGGLSSSTSDLEVHALGVVLSTTSSTSGVESDDLVTDYIVAGGNVARNGRGP